MTRDMTKPIKWVCAQQRLRSAWASVTWQNQQNECVPTKTQISLGICLVWSESPLSAWRKLGSLATHWVHSKDSDQTGQMPRLIWVFAGQALILLVLSFRGSYIYCWLNLHWPAPVAQLAECPLQGMGGHGFDFGPRHTKVVKNGTSCSSLGLVNPVSGYYIMSSVRGMILQWGSTIKVSIELPVATRHRRDMTEKLLKATLNPANNKINLHYVVMSSDMITIN